MTIGSVFGRIAGKAAAQTAKSAKHQSQLVGA
jgi:hypothetical protein